MSPTHHLPTAADLTAAWRNTTTAWEIALAAPTVIVARTHRMARAGALPGPRDQREFTRMAQEKAEAFGEAWMAMGLRIVQAQVAMAASWWAQWLQHGPQRALALQPPMYKALSALVADGLAPVHRRVTANARRLAPRGIAR
jgi:hypothetical protein